MSKVAARLFLVVILLSIPLTLLSQPCPQACLACADECSLGCMSQDCQTCLQTSAPDGCYGADVPISDHAGYVLIGGLFIISAFFVRKRKLTAN
jgi:hypothetical protein